MEQEQRKDLCPNCGMSYQSRDHQLFCERRMNGDRLPALAGWGED